MNKDKMQCGSCDSENLFPPTINDTCMTCHETTVRDLKELKPHELLQIAEVEALVDIATCSTRYHGFNEKLIEALKPFQPKESND